MLVVTAYTVTSIGDTNSIFWEANAANWVQGAPKLKAKGGIVEGPQGRR